MNGLGAAILGPLAYPEWRRALSRGWIIWIRMFAGFAVAVVTWSVLWWWWFSQQLDPDRMYLPYSLFRGGLAALVGMSVAVVLVICPALLAGSLAGEKERGALDLLLTTRVNALEIVVGRLVGKLSQVGQVLLAGVPALILLAALAGIRPSAFAAMLALPAATAFGIGGLALAASVLSRRGRDALLTVYLLALLFLMTTLPASYLPLDAIDAIAWLNPFTAIGPLAWFEAPAPASRTILGWCLMGLVGVGVAAWRLRPACLNAGTGAAEARRKRGRRRWLVPPLDERRPMLWKELFIERVGSLGRVGRWLGMLMVLLLGGGGVLLTGLVIHYSWFRDDPIEADHWLAVVRATINDTGWWVSALIQLAIGLRAAVAISSERERGTWDALLTSPLEGREVVTGKLWGCLNAMRWLLAASLLAWTLALSLGAMPPGRYAYLVAETLICGAFMAAVGIRSSLASSTATRAMAVTVGTWLVCLGGIAAVSAALVGFLAAVYMLVTWELSGGVAPAASPFTFQECFAIVQILTYALITALVVLESALRFDRIAGRIAGGSVQVAVDQALHGLPTAPVLIEDQADR